MKCRLLWVAVAVAIGGVWNWMPSPDHNRAVGQGTELKKEKDQPKIAAKPAYAHNVIWYLKPDAPKDEVETLIADAHRLLSRIPSVKGLWVGRPAEKATPRLAVTDYHVAMLLLFDDHAGLQEYLEHKLHLEFRAKHAKHAERLLVYDFVNQQK